MYVDIRVFDWVLLFLIIYMIGALVAYIGEPAEAGRRSKTICMIGAIGIVIFGVIKLLGLGL